MCKSYIIKVWIIALTIIASCTYIITSYFNSGDDTVKSSTDLIIEKYQQQSHARATYLNKNIKKEGYYALYNVLVPEVVCKDLIRIGSISDGGKWICNPLSLQDWPKCNIYSLGISNNPSFEEDLQSFLKNKCNVRSVDRDDQSPVTLERIKKINGIFKTAVIGGERNKTSNTYTFNNILSVFGDNRVDILKIDIEGAEFDILNEIVSTPICQILIEVHGKTPVQTYELLQTLSKNGFYLFSYEINGAFHDLCEYSFIHKNCLSLFNVTNILGKYLS